MALSGERKGVHLDTKFEVSGNICEERDKLRDQNIKQKKIRAGGKASLFDVSTSSLQLSKLGDGLGK